RARGRAGPGAGGFGGFGGGGPGGAGGFRARGPDARYALEIDFLEAVKGATKRITLPDGGTLDVKIPEGVEDGQTIRLRGKGGEGYGGGPPGDAMVTLSVRPHPVFRREGADIHVTLPITLDEAVLGGKVAAPTIDGSVRVTVPECASGGRTLRLRGRGVARGQGKGRGDQFVTLRIVSPPEIDDDLKRFMKEWRETHAYDPRKGMT
ncbi:molecular chaperone DnaJ, partial [Rhodobacteraceae bacterium WD3A24]